MRGFCSYFDYVVSWLQDSPSWHLCNWQLRESCSQLTMYSQSSVLYRECILHILTDDDVYCCIVLSTLYRYACSIWHVFTHSYSRAIRPIANLWCLFSPKPETSFYCKTTDTGLLHRMVCLFSSQLSLVFIVFTHRGMPGWFDLGSWLHIRMYLTNLTKY